MGVAAYQRGNRAITRGIAMDLGEPDPFRPYIATPRPDGWGDKALMRAADVARRSLRGARRYGLALDRDVLILAVVDRARVGEATAARGVDIALAEDLALRGAP